ncbi:MAG: glycoside hydrolase family 16 protein [Chloroflexota bacterium]
MRSRGSQGAVVVLYLLGSLLVLGVLAVTLPTLATGADAPAPLGRPPMPTATPEVVPTPTPLPTIVAYVPATAAPAGAAPVLLPVGQTGPWHLVFQDEFDGSTLDSGAWIPCYPWYNPATGCTSEGNDELQWYLPKRVKVQDGALTLSVQPERYRGTDGILYAYTSGLVSSAAYPATGPGFAFQYGYAEARLKIPTGRGLSPAFWLSPADGSWPPEIDIAERVGGTSPNKIEMVLHYPLPQGGHDFDTTHFAGPDFSAEWHDFGVEWTPTSVTWYIDGVARKTYTKLENIPRKAMHLIFSLAVRGDQSPDENVKFPAIFSVDYVRVWQR